jgi:hypothetical protein
LFEEVGNGRVAEDVGRGVMKTAAEQAVKKEDRVIR